MKKVKPSENVNVAIKLFNMYEYNEGKPVPDTLIRRILNLEYSTLVCSGNYNY